MARVSVPLDATDTSTPSRRGQSRVVAGGKGSRRRPPSALGRWLSERLTEQYDNNMTRFALALGVSRQTLYGWLSSSHPPIPDPRHRQRIARILGVDVSVVDTAIVTALGYSVAAVTPKTLPLAAMAEALDPDDVDQLERQAMAMRRRDAALRKQSGRRT